MIGMIGLVGLAAAYTLLVRPWHMRWGATDEELHMATIGDPFIPAGAIVSTRAITIDAPVAAVWPWLAQLGQGHGGFYSYDWLENLFAAGMHNAERIHPEWQNIHVGDHISLQRGGPFGVITAIDPGRAIATKGGWTYSLRPIDANHTRLIVRYAWDGSLVYYFAIFEEAHFVMESGMMLGIKQHAEAQQ